MGRFFLAIVAMVGIMPFELGVGLVGSSSSAIAQESVPQTAPFGLTWGMRLADVEKLGVKLTPADDASESFGPTYRAVSLPKTLKDIAGVAISFDYGGRLWRVLAYSTAWPNDAYGRGIRDRYDELAALLTERYGPGEVVHYTPSDTFYSRPDNFVYSLYKNERQHFTNWEVSDTKIQLAIRPQSMDTTYFNLIYQYTPFKADVSKKVKQREKDAL